MILSLIMVSKILHTIDVKEMFLLMIHNYIQRYLTLKIVTHYSLISIVYMTGQKLTTPKKYLSFSTNVSITSDYVNAYVSPNFYVIDNINNLKDLGIIMSSNCSFEQHIIELRKRCTGLCGWILRTFSSRESTVMMTKIHQIIMIEKIQKAFTKHIIGFSSFSYQESLSNLKIYCLQRRRERYIVIYVWKILENLVPNLVKPLQFYVSDRRGRLYSVSHVRLGH